ncbi:MAG: penicillin acylase family protein [Deltaproteobacteria bacterium]|nr:penicillin acylase family protein [Candidatus Zymogenaceae bacterium]
MKIKNAPVTLPGIVDNVTITRMEGGYPKIEAKNSRDAYYALGYMHGYDRQVQLWLTKLIGTGRASECLEGSDELVAVDRYFRWVDLVGDADSEIEKLTPEVLQTLHDYCRGVNNAVERTPRPLGFRMVGFRPDPWTVRDIILIGRIIGFVGLTQSQGTTEKLIIQMLQNGIDYKKLQELFPYMTDTLTPERLELIKKVKLDGPYIPDGIEWLRAATSFHASNNWAVSPSKTADGAAILCGDPHLESNRLPSVWYEAMLDSPEVFGVGVTLPGAPFISMGRCRHIAWTGTYSFVDVIDYFIEEVKDGKYRRGDEWVDFTVRKETIIPKKKDPITISYYETDLGLLEGEPTEDGFYLTFAWSARKGCIAESLNRLLELPAVRTVSEAMDIYRDLTFSAFNWAVADTEGNIGYQMCGAFPKKAKGASGLLPLEAWDKKNHWQGIISAKEYPQLYNPKKGYVHNANEDVNHLGKVKPQNLPMGSYRADRIAAILAANDSLTVDDMKRMHYDTYSVQAERFMKVIRPLLPETENGRILKNWDLKYDPDSLGAVLFERVYEELIRLVFGEMNLGAGVIDFALTETGLFNDFYGFFDDVLMKERSLWFGEKSREEIFREAVTRGLSKKAVPYRKVHSIVMTNLFFGGKLPKFLGFDYGPVPLIGSRATIPQGQIFTEAGRKTTFMPSYRVICNMGENAIHSNIPGGPSDRRFSGFYTTGVREYYNGTYTVHRFENGD